MKQLFTISTFLFSVACYSYTPSGPLVVSADKASVQTSTCTDGENILKQMEPRCGKYNTVTGGLQGYDYYICQANVVREAYNTCKTQMTPEDDQAFRKPSNN